jgi:hypothetical protein
MWAALLTVAALSLLISSALAVIATYLYFREKGRDVGHTGVPSIAPDDVLRFDLDEHDI